MDLPFLDPIIAIIVGIMILKIGVELILKAGTGLMDESSKETEIQIRKVMDRHQHRFVDYHNLMTRKSGDKVFAELHLSVQGDISVQEAHDFTEHLQADLENDVPNVVITIHIEPP
jgi:divalent metal cation (Fe/Co/Zn/Cd) transporter